MSAASTETRNSTTISISTIPGQVTATTTTSCRAQSEPTNDYRVVVFGSAGVGKSSLVLRFVKGTFKETYVPTIEDTYRQVINCNKQVCTLQITDTTGSHQFPAMQRLNIQKGHAFILVYSITNKQTLEELKPIYKDILEIKGRDDILNNNVPIMLVGSKCDENSNRVVQTAAVSKLSQEWHCSFIETSAKTNVNVKEAFEQLLKLDTRNNFSLNASSSNKSSSSASPPSPSSSTNTNSSKNNKKLKKGASLQTEKTQSKKCVIS